MIVLKQGEALMERGPMALFGAIIAVGLGPAMWLGAQFGNASDLPAKPPAVTSEHKPQQDRSNGGAAGSAPDDPSVVVDTDPRADIQPLDDDATQPRPAATGAGTTHHKPRPDPSASSASPTPTGADSDDPPTESTDPPPSDGGTGNGGGSGDGGGTGNTVEPSPPAGGGGDTGGTGAGTGTQTPAP
jgi:hypothetical protein